jgi:hypothetical protein
MNKLPIRIIVIFIMMLTLVLSSCTAVDTTLEPENKTSNPSRFIMYNPDLTVFNSFFVNPGYYYIVDTYTDNVQEYLNLRKEYNALAGDNTMQGRMKRGEIANRMRTI